MTIRSMLLVSLVLAAAAPAIAGERTDVTPPLYREQARTTAAVRPASELATTPSLAPAADQRATVETVASASRD